MPEFNTVADIIRFNDLNIKDYGVTNLFKKTPLISALGADLASQGVVHQYTRETGLPSVGFRELYRGVVDSTPVSETVTIALKILAASCTVDWQEAKQNKRIGIEGVIKKRVDANLAAEFIKAETQVLYGQVGGDSTGFAGLADQTFLDGTGDEMVVNATGTGSDLTDIWLICSNDQGTDVQLVLGQDGIIEIGETVMAPVIQSADSNTALNKKFPGYYTPVEGYMGLQVGATNSVCRIVNVGTATGKTATDALIYQGFDKLAKYGKRPDYIVMAPRSLSQIRASRTATNPVGTPAPYPTELEGVPFIVTPQVKVNMSAIA